MADLGCVRYSGGYEERDDVEMPARGYRSDVVVELADGREFRMSFYDLPRLSQVLADEVRSGACHFSEPGLVVLVEVTRENIEAAVSALARSGYFDQQVDRGARA